MGAVSDLATASTQDDALRPIPAHGGRLVCRLAGAEEREELEARARELPLVRLSARQLSDLGLIAVGALSPLEGFMEEADYGTVLHDMHLASGLAWTIPVTLAVERETARTLSPGDEVALARDGGRPLAALEVRDLFEYDKREEARLVYQTEDETHPGVAAVYAQGEVCLGGRLTAFGLQPVDDVPKELSLSPAETRRIFAERGWRRVVGFQTRNPIHRAHEYLQKCALEMADGLLVHPLVGETKGDDISSAVRMRCYRTLVKRYFPKERVLLAAWPAAMRYAGPREAIFHAVVRKNYGCTHFIVGRDHAGVGSYYGTYDAQRIFDEFDEQELGIRPLFFDHAFFCKACSAMATSKTCAHGADERVALSGTKVREMLARGEAPPEEFTRPEIAAILLEAAAKEGR